MEELGVLEETRATADQGLDSVWNVRDEFNHWRDN